MVVGRTHQKAKQVADQAGRRACSLGFNYAPFAVLDTHLRVASREKFPVPVWTRMLWLGLKPSFFFFFLILFIFRGMAREGERERNNNVQEIYRLVASHVPPTGDLACNPGMCPDGIFSNLSVFRMMFNPLSHTSQG